MADVPNSVDLTACDREPIHVPGTILPHGAMLVLDPTSLVIEQAAGDTQRLLGHPVAALLGQRLETVVPFNRLARLIELRRASSLAKPRHLLDPAFRVLADVPVDASIHMSGDCLVLELEDADLVDRHATDPLTCVQDMIEGLDAASSLQVFCQMAADRVRAAVKYDRVMIYRFMDDGSGWVYAESCRAEAVPFLDLHYPASDIPKQARALYLASWLRLITQVDYEPAPLLPPLNPRSGQKLDMSHAVLRDVSPIHREYLRNMGVDASMSISILREGKLWGLIACHHGSPRRLPRHLRAACELFGSMLSLQLEARERAELLIARLSSRKMLSQMMHSLAAEDDYAAGVASEAGNLLDYLGARQLTLAGDTPRGGLAIRLNNAIFTRGDTPSQAAINELTGWLTTQTQDNDGVVATDRLGELWPPAAAYAGTGSGLLAIAISRKPEDFIMWFRPEVVRTVTWGGDPTKPVEIGPNGTRLTPRKSFDAWTETVRGRSSPWTAADHDAAFDLRVSLLEVVLRRIDAAARERVRAFEHERLLMAELDHRVKNTLANIQALVAQTGRNSNSLQEFTTGLDRRIRAMSRAHSLLTQSRWEGVSIGNLVQEELAPYTRQGSRITQGGPTITITPKAALSLSLAIHELVTNAAKYGALSAAAGEVSVLWRGDAKHGVYLTWQEAGGPAVPKKRGKGFGSTLIERALAMETAGKSVISFDPQGVRCEVYLPAAAITRVDAERPPAAEAEPAEMRGNDDDRPRRILVVEDSALVVMLIEDVLQEMGWVIVGPVGEVDAAVAMATTEPFDAALLDVNLHNAMSWPVADVLVSRGIPFLFTTGYDSGTIMPDRFLNAEVYNKPFQIEGLIDRLHTLTGRRATSNA